MTDGGESGLTYGARFVAELETHLDGVPSLARHRLRQLESRDFDGIAAALRTRLEPNGDAWLQRMRLATPEEFARSLVRAEHARQSEEGSSGPWWRLLVNLLTLASW